MIDGDVFMIQIPLSEDKSKVTTQGKVISLFEFIRELNKLKQRTIINVRDYPWYRFLADFPDDSENISVSYRDRVDDEQSDADSVIASIHKPEFQACPMPPDNIIEWLENGWDSWQHTAHYLESKIIEQADDENVDSDDFTGEEIKTYEYFNDDYERVNSYTHWIEKRNLWVEKQKLYAQTRDLFAELYRLYFELERDSETIEMVVSNGILFDSRNTLMNHPVITRRVGLRYDAEKNTVYIEDVDVQTELYAAIFEAADDLNLNAINQLLADLRANDYHPLDRNDTPGFLKVLIHQLSSDSLFSNVGEVEDWKRNARFLMSMNPCFLVRKRLDGTLSAIAKIIEDVQETGEVPAPICDIVDGGEIDVPEDAGEASIEEQLAAVGGESVDILLSKEANREQLEIAKRIEHYNAVLVQGPPGTGKTHTIANLMGHFLAQGKSVLVTSHTKKALSVLKDKITPGLQNLCVSVLDDSNADMEKSVDGITDYMSRTTSYELRREMDSLGQERNNIIGELASVRRKLYTIIRQERGSIVFQGEELSPSFVAAFVHDHAEDLSYIPGNVKLYSSIPLTHDQLLLLYRSNGAITSDDESELNCDLPNPDSIMDPDTFLYARNSLLDYQRELEGLLASVGWKIKNATREQTISFTLDFGAFQIPYPNQDAIVKFKDYLQSVGKIEKWMENAAVDGFNGGAYRQRWERLILSINETCSAAEVVAAEQFGIDVTFADGTQYDVLVPALQKMKQIFINKGKIPKISRLLDKSLDVAFSSAFLNGRSIQNERDCDVVLHEISIRKARTECGRYWNELLATNGLPQFSDLDMRHPEHIARNYVPMIQRSLNWYRDELSILKGFLHDFQIPEDVVFLQSALDSDIARIGKILSAIDKSLPNICNICLLVLQIEKYTTIILKTKGLLENGTRTSSKICNGLIDAITKADTEAYRCSYLLLKDIYEKYALRKTRSELLQQLSVVAPQWAEAIELRQGIHGEVTVPATIDDAWKWKQLSGILAELAGVSFGELQEDSIRLGKAYRRTTALYAEKSAWYHLMKATERNLDIRMALQGWKQTIKKIGKGTGKNAPRLKAKARELMGKCQTAVPGWIMPIGRALESLNPQINKFDIVIIDEASQSDISSLAILYMGKKLIIVGDDKQVSPMAVGVEADKMTALEEMYLKGKIPNSHLYNAKTSIYDIAATVFQPLMLREHFRCVPEIIGFSNALSYDGKIKPLRDASSSVLLPAVVNYRVEDGERNGRAKTNQNEARAIIALLKACMEQPEYAGKTFGIISMLGDEQVKVLQRLMFEYIEGKYITDRHILVGNASNFQGDERDVIFLSIVDSSDFSGPLSLTAFGPDDAYRKRYNVASSRAKDQLWVVDSLNPVTDLKPGDIRKMLIDYSINPDQIELQHKQIEEDAESPFEASVAKALNDKGFHLIQQKQVGAYRLDMVVVCGKNSVAIECDGEKYHSGEAKIREDMERQTILERLGWRFIRIRGSEYYRDPASSIERVISEMDKLGIYPESKGDMLLSVLHCLFLSAFSVPHLEPSVLLFLR